MHRKLLPLLCFIVSFQLFPQQSVGISKELLLGKLNYEHQEEFVRLDREHAAKTIFLNREVYAAFVQMYNAAKADSIDLRIISGARNFESQKAIWENKWKTFKDLAPLARTKKILEFSSMPATSRHHWGTDIDLNNLENSYFEREGGKREYEWLTMHANDFGFFQVYTAKSSGRTGYEEEKWHWSYLPLANRYLEAYNQIITSHDISDFKGSYLADAIKVISAYVNGIAPAPAPPANLVSIFQQEQETLE